jgi:Tfp pilus assembly protein PilF
MSVTADAQFQRAVAFFEHGQSDEARSACKDVLKREARHAPALHLLGILAYHAGRYDDARRLFKKAAAITPSRCSLILPRCTTIAQARSKS